MATEDWFRSDAWDEEIERSFFQRLERSRSQRDQYLVIQAMTLASKNPDVALKLTDLYFSGKTSDSEDLRALLARAEALLAKHKISDALDAFKQVLALERQKPNQKSRAFIDFPFLVATGRVAEEYLFAVSILNERKADLKFPVDHFKWNAAMSLIRFAEKDFASAKVYASTALDAAQIKKSGFRFHSKLGIVGKDYAETVDSLRAICR